MRFALRNRVYFGADLLGWAAIPFLALTLRLDGFASVGPYLPHLILFGAIAIPCKLFALWVAGLYRRYWRYASVEELGLIVLAVLAAGVAAGALYFFLAVPLVGLQPRLPLSLPVLDTLLTLIFVGGLRFSARFTEHLLQKRQGVRARERVLVVGAGSGGTVIVRELRANPQLEMEPVGFVDDDPAKHGNTICGLRVLGGRDRIPELARDYVVHTVIIAMRTAPGSVIREIRDICHGAGLATKTIPVMSDILSGRVSVSQLRDVEIEDLLRREPVRTDQRAVGKLVRGTTVLVTGAGGSIGSEICRQVAALGARELILLGHGENSIFDVHHELERKNPDTQVVPVIGDIRNGARLDRIFDKYRPQTVFHAAAHKHVPLMELNPEEAVTNNVLGTLNVLAAAERCGVVRFVFISTDKAVNPINIMGATKLVAERLVHDAAERTGKPYVSVRFGNVLASRGSVVPLFQKQIAAGGPVTVTDRKMTRYFMTIPEAVQLVLQAAAIGRGGETFLLDMGKPVKIFDLAHDLVHLSGLEVDKDIEIVFTGLRPGEKLFEELYATGDNIGRTAHEKIFIVHNGVQPPIPDHQLQELTDAAVAGQERLRHLIVDMVLSDVETGSEAEGSGRLLQAHPDDRPFAATDVPVDKRAIGT